MHELIPDGGVIRKLWLHEADQYRDHLLRLDTPSRRNRFGGAASDDRVREHVNSSIMLDAVIHGFFVDGYDNPGLNDVTIAGFTVRYALYEGILVVSASDVALRDNKVENNEASKYRGNHESRIEWA